MSTFDPDTFMNQNVDQPLETEYKLCPKGEFQATIDDFTSEAFETFEFEYKKGNRAGQPGSMTKFNCPFVINDAKAQQELGRDKVTVTRQFILELENGSIAGGPNKNVALGQLVAAVGVDPKQPWQFSQLRGRGPLMVKVDHIKFDRKDGTKGERAEVVRCAPIR